MLCNSMFQSILAMLLLKQLITSKEKKKKALAVTKEEQIWKPLVQYKNLEIALFLYRIPKYCACEPLMGTVLSGHCAISSLCI